MANSLSRRDLFGLFRKSINAATSEVVPLRPPGAIAEAMFSDTCARCGACIDACPRQAIKPLPMRFGNRAETPYIVPREAPCVLCNGLLCTTVCPSGALRRVSEPKDVRMGTAVVDAKRCLPWQDQQCSTCLTACPIPGALVADEKGRPKVTAACTGCGICEYYCPTVPAAITIRPKAAR
jgi:ferredoxin-type protein NapG